MQSRRPLMPYSLVLTFIFDFDNYIPAVLKKGDLKNYYQKLRNSACKNKKKKKKKKPLLIKFYLFIIKIKIKMSSSIMKN